MFPSYASEHIKSEDALNESIIPLCPTCVERVLYGLKLDSKFNSDTFPSDYFLDPMHRIEVFGSLENYSAFIRLLLVDPSLTFSLRQSFEKAMSKTDYLRHIRIAVTNDWASMTYLPLFFRGSRFNPDSLMTFTESQIKHFSEFMYDFCSAYGEVEHLNPSKQNVHIRIAICEDMETNWSDTRRVYSTSAIVLIFTDQDKLTGTYNSWYRYNKSPRSVFTTLLDWDVPVAEFNERLILEKADQLYRMQSGVGELYALNDNESGYRVNCYGIYGEIGLRQLMTHTDPVLFDYSHSIY